MTVKVKWGLRGQQDLAFSLLYRHAPRPRRKEGRREAASYRYLLINRNVAFQGRLTSTVVTCSTSQLELWEQGKYFFFTPGSINMNRYRFLYLNVVLVPIFDINFRKQLSRIFIVTVNNR